MRDCDPWYCVAHSPADITLTDQEAAALLQGLTAEQIEAVLMVRDVMLPSGMTRECLDELAGLFNWRCAEECDCSNDEFAIRAFEVLRRHLR
jgi:hypothetical protein